MVDRHCGPNRRSGMTAHAKGVLLDTYRPHERLRTRNLRLFVPRQLRWPVHRPISFGDVQTSSCRSPDDLRRSLTRGMLARQAASSSKQPCVLIMPSGSGTVRSAAGCRRRVGCQHTPVGRIVRASAAVPQASDSASWRASWLHPKTLSCRSMTPHMCLPRAGPRFTFSRTLCVEDVSEPPKGTGEVRMRARSGHRRAQCSA